MEVHHTRMSMDKASLKFGGPFRGYVSSIAKHRVASDSIAQDSLNVVINPLDGSLMRRAGSTISVNTLTTATSNVEADNITSAAMSTRVRKLAPLDSPSMTTDNYPVPSAVIGKESNPSFPSLDTGYFGNHVLQDVTAGINYELGEEFSSTYYPTAGGSIGTLLWNVPPLWYESGEGGYTRGATEFSRRFLTAGSRSFVDGTSWRYFPDYRGTPARWGKRCNPDARSEYFRLWPTGPWGPIVPSTIAAGTAAGTSNAQWTAGDSFFHSVIFQFEDGSYSLPFIPRPNTTVSNWGFVTIGTIASGTKYADIAWTNIPIGPEGTVRRILLRSPKQNLAATTDILTISYGDLRITGVLNNNTQTSYTDTNGSDTGLLDDSNIVRFDYVLPRRARYNWTGDQRQLIGYTLPNPCAIMLAPQNDNGTPPANIFNVVDTNTSGMLSGANVATYSVSINGADTEVKLNSYIGAVLTTNTYSSATYTTLQSLIDKINSDAATAAKYKWAAALAPGIDGSTATTSLCPTKWTSTSSTSAASTSLVVDATTYSNVPLGYLIYDSAGKVPAGAYVTAKTGSNTFTISAAASGAGSAAALVFYPDTGDTATNGGGTAAHGCIRAFCPTVPGLIHLKRSSLVSYDKPDKQSVYFTVSSPGAMTSGVSFAPNSFVAGNKRTVDSRLGACMGGADIEGAAVVAYARGIQLFINQRGVTSGEDFDYRLVDINKRRGCISPQSLFTGNGVAGYLTTQGIVITDKSRQEKIISNDIYNPTSKVGDLASEIAACAASANADTDDMHFHAAVIGAQLHISYRSSGTGVPNRRMVYDFSPSTEASGIAELVQPQTGQAFGWSAPISGNSYSDMCEISRGSGPEKWAWSDTNAVTDGRLDKFDLSTASGKDNGKNFSAVAYSPTIVAPPFKHASTKRASVEHLGAGSSTVGMYSTIDLSDVSTATLSNTSGQMLKQIVPFAQTQRRNSPAFTFYWLPTSTDGDSASLWRFDVETDLVDANA